MPSKLFLLVVIAFSTICTASCFGTQTEDAEVSKPDEIVLQSESDEHGDESPSHEHEAGEHGDAAEDGHAEHGHSGVVTANQSSKATDATEFRSEKAIATWIVFGLLILGLSVFAWKPISEGLEKREVTIAGNIAHAEKAAAEADAKLAAYEKQIAGANEEAAEIVAQARKDAEATQQRMIEEAQAEASRQRERATAEIDSAKRVALNELAEKSTDVAVDLAKRVVGREVNATDHQNLIQEMLSKLPSKN